MALQHSKRILELDGLRGLAVLFVVIHHYFTGPLPAEQPTAIRLFLDVTAPFFLSGVDLFFVISGFIVGGIVIDNARRPEFFRWFYIRRATRIFPLYFGMFVLFLIAVAIDSRWPNPMGIWLLRDNADSCLPSGIPKVARRRVLFIKRAAPERCQGQA